MQTRGIFFGFAYLCHHRIRTHPGAYFIPQHESVFRL